MYLPESNIILRPHWGIDMPTYLFCQSFKTGWSKLKQTILSSDIENTCLFKTASIAASVLSIALVIIVITCHWFQCDAWQQLDKGFRPTCCLLVDFYLTKKLLCLCHDASDESVSLAEWVDSKVCTQATFQWHLLYCIQYDRHFLVHSVLLRLKVFLSLSHTNHTFFLILLRINLWRSHLSGYRLNHCPVIWNLFFYFKCIEVVPDVEPRFPPVGAAISAFMLSRSGRHVKDVGFTYPVTWRLLRVKGKGCASVWHVGWTHSLTLSFSSAGEICYSRLLCRFALELGEFQKEQESGAVKGWWCQYSPQ